LKKKKKTFCRKFLPQIFAVQKYLPGLMKPTVPNIVLDSNISGIKDRCLQKIPEMWISAFLRAKRIFAGLVEHLKSRFQKPWKFLKSNSSDTTFQSLNIEPEIGIWIFPLAANNINYQGQRSSSNKNGCQVLYLQGKGRISNKTKRNSDQF